MIVTIINNLTKDYISKELLNTKAYKATDVKNFSSKELIEIGNYFLDITKLCAENNPILTVSILFKIYCILKIQNDYFTANISLTSVVRTGRIEIIIQEDQLEILEDDYQDLKDNKNITLKVTIDNLIPNQELFLHTIYKENYKILLMKKSELFGIIKTELAYNLCRVFTKNMYDRDHELKIINDKLIKNDVIDEFISAKQSRDIDRKDRIKEIIDRIFILYFSLHRAKKPIIGGFNYQDYRNTINKFLQLYGV